VVYKATGIESFDRHIDENIRVSEISNTLFKFKLDIVKGSKKNEKLQIVSEEFEFLRYNVGGRFDVHTDRSRYTEHTHSVCIYPPQQVEGGELVLFRSPEKTEIKMSPDTWIVVVFPIEMPHASNPVVCGQKYMFKGTCSLYTLADRPHGQIRFNMGRDDRTHGEICD
jgi:Rps23 Pro-64 3,4-dihydroxylase Tpa1-like proline 4-hydroxylase